MQIKTKLRLNTFISVSTVILILAALVWSWRVITVTERKMTFAYQMRETAFERIFLRDEFLIFQQAETAQLWLAQSEQLKKLIIAADSIFRHDDSKELLRAARQDFDATFSGFSKIINSRSGQSGKAGFNAAELQQISQVFLKANELNTTLNRLHILTHEKAEAQRNKGIVTVVLVIFCGVVAIIINSTVIRRTIASRLTSLDKGVEIIGSGNLDYQIEVIGNDELSDLARLTNMMTAKLKNSYTTVVQLQHEVAERIKIERLLREQEFWLHESQRIGGIGSYILYFQTNVWISSSILDDIFGIAHDDEKTVASWNALVHPDEQQEMLTYFNVFVAGGKHKFDKEYRIIRKNDGEFRWLWGLGELSFDEDGNLLKMTGVILDITERKLIESKLKAAITELQNSNKELEQFAYVASHDLQEPLRMVSSYTQLLAERYQDKLDDKANLFIHYAVDGAVRMQLLINDLLAYSRIGTKGKPLAPVDAHAVLVEALNNLKMTIDETKAIITNDKLPEVRADASQLAQLFQNLLGNALKFRGDAYPLIHIAVRDEVTAWRFSVKDNGIGIDPQFADKIFVIFQRLHTKEEYPGSGIGLAICKKIVERHGGRIWFESEPGKGATFYFTIKK